MDELDSPSEKIAEIGNLTVMHNTGYCRGKVFCLHQIYNSVKVFTSGIETQHQNIAETVPQPYGAPCTCMECILDLYVGMGIDKFTILSSFRCSSSLSLLYCRRMQNTA